MWILGTFCSLLHPKCVGAVGINLSTVSLLLMRFHIMRGDVLPQHFIGFIVARQLKDGRQQLHNKALGLSWSCHRLSQTLGRFAKCSLNACCPIKLSPVEWDLVQCVMAVCAAHSRFIHSFDLAKKQSTRAQMLLQVQALNDIIRCKLIWNISTSSPPPAEYGINVVIRWSLQHLTWTLCVAVALLLSVK